MSHFVARVREQAGDLATGSCEPALLDRLARTYFGFDSGHRSADPVEALRISLDSDESLVSAALSAFGRALERDDLPALDEVVRLDAEGRRSLLALPVLAGLAESDRTGSRAHQSLTTDGIKGAVGFHYLCPRPMVQSLRPGWYRRAEAPDWYDELVRSRPEPVAESLVVVHRSKIRRKLQCEEHLASVARSPKYRELARLAAPSLLRAFPVRCTRPQILALRHLLWASVRHMPDGFAPLVATKLARDGMDIAQRALWLGAGMLVSPDRCLAAAMEFIGGGSTSRVQHLVDFVVPDALPPFSMEWSTEHLAMAVRGVGARVDATTDKAGRLLSAWLAGLAKKPGAKAADALESLAVAPELTAWRHDILEARHQQAKRRRARPHRIPTADEVRNPADLLAVLVSRLERLATEIRDGNAIDWRRYWSAGTDGRPAEPRPEPACRAAFLTELQGRLPAGVGVNAERTRSDVRVACGGHTVPVEIKTNAHPRLWSAISDPLIDQCARAPESGGCGVYLVLWFGARRTKTVPPSGRYPKTPEALRDRLREGLSPDQKRKIKVVVVDVGPPTDRAS